MEDDIRRSHEAGFTRHLTKPVTLQALEAAIRQVLQREVPSAG
jgi:CheY-like chemotaxis protein